MATREASRAMVPLCVVGLSVAFALGGCGAAGQTVATQGQAPAAAASATSPTPSGPVTIATLETMARNMAANAADPHVTEADAVLTTRQAANTATSGSIVNSNEPAFLVEMHGTFIGRDASGPPGAKPPTGTYLIFIVDASDGAVTDWGLMHKKADLAALGTVIPLSW